MEAFHHKQRYIFLPLLHASPSGTPLFKRNAEAIRSSRVRKRCVSMRAEP